MKQSVFPLSPLLLLILTLSVLPNPMSAQSITSVSTLSGCGTDFFSDTSTPVRCHEHAID
jgi:hypothetical protein